jgi:hypothetical protein
MDWDRRWNHPYAQCLSDPFHFFRFENKLQIEELGTKAGDVKHLGNLSMGYDISGYNIVNETGKRGYVERYALEFGVRATTTRFGINPMFGGTAGTNEYIEVEENRANGAWTRRGPRLVIDQVTMQATATRYRRCLSVTPKPETFLTHRFEKFERDLFKDRKDRRAYYRPGILLCSPIQTVPVKFQEEYFMVSHENKTRSGLISSRHLDGKPLLVIVRGAVHFAQFIRNIEDSIIAFDPDLGKESIVTGQKVLRDVARTYENGSRISLYVDPINSVKGLFRKYDLGYFTSVFPGMYTEYIDMNTIRKALRESYQGNFGDEVLKEADF